MDNMPKRRLKPTAVCQYGKSCYRKNPHHFMEYAHDHLDTILVQGTSSSGNYQIPSELNSQKVTILEQLKILAALFPNAKLEPAAKKERNEADVKPRNEAGSPKVEQRPVQPSTDAKLEQDQPNTSSASTSRQSSEDEVVLLDADPKHGKNSPSVRIQEHPRNIHDYIPVVLPRGKAAEKLKAAEPYNYFLTVITASKQTHSEPQSITFQEILDPSLGEIESSVQINFMVDVGWLLGQYHFAGCLDKPLLIIYGEDRPELKSISQKKPQVTAHFVQMPPFATHHTKMMLLGYKDGSMRVVISTANLYEDDWHNRTQGLWISPRLDAMPEGADTTAGESPTGFRNDLLRYLTSYNLPKLQPWLIRIRKSNFSAINVFLIASIPGSHQEVSNNGYLLGHGRVSWLLSKHCAPVPDSSPVIAQSSSIGSFGANPQSSWVLNEFLNSLRRDSAPMGLRKMPQFKMVYPSIANVMGSHDGILGGGCLPYGDKVHSKQKWLEKYMCQWKTNARFRTKAMPHIKTYARYTGNKVHYFVLTSANLSIAAWGAYNKSAKLNVPLRIRNYEAGVLFLPKYVTGTEHFPLDKAEDDIPPFPRLYDLPLTPYASDDTAFVMDYLMSAMS